MQTTHEWQSAFHCWNWRGGPHECTPPPTPAAGGPKRARDPDLDTLSRALRRAQAVAYRYLPSGAADASFWIAHALGNGFDLHGPAGRGQHPDRSDRRYRDRWSKMTASALGIWLERPVQVQGQNNVTDKAIFWAQVSEPSATAWSLRLCITRRSFETPAVVDVDDRLAQLLTECFPSWQQRILRRLFAPSFLIGVTDLHQPLIHMVPRYASSRSSLDHSATDNDLIDCDPVERLDSRPH